MTVNPHQSLIQAICNRDIATIEKFMDNEALHFQTEKDVAVKYLGEFFEMIASFYGEQSITSSKTSCTTCTDFYGNIIAHHDHVVKFRISNSVFALDITPTCEDQFKLDYCEYFYESDEEKDLNLGRVGIHIPYDLMNGFKPDSIYLKLKAEKEKMLAEIDNGSIVFWFVEDLTAWLIKNEWAKIGMFNQGPVMHAFSKMIDILYMMEYLNDGLIAENECKIANGLFDKLNHGDLWEIYEWLEKHRRLDYVSISPSELNLEYVHEGYLTFKDFLPNLRFSVYGHTEFLKCIHNMDLAYKVTEEIRRDRLLEDIEDEWYWEDDEEGPEPSDQYYLDIDEG